MVRGMFILENFWQILSFIGVQYSLGRRGSYPYGLLLDFSLFKITSIVVISDMLQTVFLLNLLVVTRQKCKWLRRKKKKIADLENKNTRGIRIKFKEWIKKHSSLGLIVISALPYGGGALTGSIIAVSIQIEKKKAFLLITTGCILGSVFYYLGFAGILSLFR